MQPLRFGVAGLGGWGVEVSNALLDFQAGDSSTAKLSAACDPNLSINHDRANFLRSRGVQVLADFTSMLSMPIDAVWLPVPIALHREFTIRALTAGKAVLVEKPAAGSLKEVDAMITARDRAGLPVAVAFQHLYDPATWETKRRLLGGSIGRPKRATVIGCAPRNETYYTRNGWAGRITASGTPVLDSPANNAMSHFMNLALFLLGPSLRESATIEHVEAELYRANDIENYDTCTLRLTTADGVQLLIALTHASETIINPIIEIQGNDGSLVFTNLSDFTFINGENTDTLPIAAAPLAEVVKNFTAFARGDSAAPHASLENARAHTAAIVACQECGPVIVVPNDIVRTKRGDHGAVNRFIPDIEQALQMCVQSGQLLSEVGLMSAMTAR